MKNKFVAFLFFIVCLLIVIDVSIICFDIIYPFSCKNEIVRVSKEKSIEPSLVAALIFSESRFNKKAKSSKGAIGLMQIMPLTAKSFYNGEEEFNEEMLFDTKVNIEIGCNFLKYLFDKYNDEITVLACYNAGEKIVNVWKGDDKYLKKSQIKYKETLNYVKKVQKVKKIYKLKLR